MRHSWRSWSVGRYNLVSMEIFRALQGYLLRYRFMLLAGLGFIIAANLAALIAPFLLQQVIDGLGHHLAAGDLLRFALAIVAAGLLAGVLQFFSRYVINSVSRHVEYDLRSDLFQHFQRLDLAYFQREKLGDLVARATNDLSAVRMLLGPGISNLCNTVVAFTVTAIAMVQIDRQLTLYSLTVMPLITVLFVVVHRRIEARFRRVQDQFGEVSARAQENFSGIRVVKAYVQERHELERFNQANAEYVRFSIAYARLNSLLWPSMYFISGLAIAILLWRGGLDVITGRIQLGQLVRFNAYLAALAWPMIALGWTFNLFQQGTVSMSRVLYVMRTQPSIADDPLSSRDTAPTRGAVAFRHVGLAYAEREVLHDISFEVPAGTSLAIVGPTGAGKSSIVNLIPRVYDPTSGAVLVDGVDVRELPLARLRRSIGYVPQETFLFGISVAENVGFGAEQIDAERLARALEVSQLGRDVAEFPHGAETMVGERGVTLSGGQKQRAGIARAVAREPLILILDDAFSSVDTQTEAQILQGLRQVMMGRTSIVIAHRISTIKDLDQIIVVDGGRIVERGTHASLVALGGLYTEMYRHQLLSEELSGDDAESDDASDLTAPPAGDLSASGGRQAEE